MPRVFYFIDEDETDGERYSALLSCSGLEVRFRLPEQDITFLEEMIKDKGVSGMILDYKLSYRMPDIQYNSPTIAGYVRERTSNIPIVTLSGALQSNQSLRSSYDRMKKFFDFTFEKSDVASDANDAQRQLLSLSKGYETLVKFLCDRRRSRNLQLAFQNILAVSDDINGLCNWLAAKAKNDPFLAAQSIIHDLLLWSGPLMSLRHSAVFLGVDPDSSEKLVKAIKPALYKGVFSDLYKEPRYWAHLLVECKLPRGIPVARCKASGKKATVLCDICHEPFDSFYTLGVKRTGATTFVENGRVCGICLQGQLEGMTIRPGSELLIDNVIAQTTLALSQDNDA